MALTWKWEDRLGTVETDMGKYFLYRGNCLYVRTAEWDEDGETKYTVVDFAANETHFKNCLGLTKGYDQNIHDDWNTITFYLNEENKKTIETMVKNIVKAWMPITINIINVEDKE